jgi:hypothetical protein
MAIPNYRIVLTQEHWDRMHGGDVAAPIARAEQDPKIRAAAATRTIEIDYSYGDLNNIYRLLRQMIGGNRKQWAEQYGTDAFKAEEQARIEQSRDALRAAEGPDGNPNDAHAPAEPTNAAEALTAVLGDAPGICLGHRHDQAQAYQFLANATDRPADFGIAGGMLFVEELPGVFQAEVTAYLTAAQAPAWSAAITAFFDRIAADRGLNGATKLDAVLARARANGLLVYGIDSGENSPALSADACYPEMRCANMNAYGKAVMDAAIAANPDRKFVAFCGSAHSNTHEGGVPGFSQIYNIPAVKLDDTGRVKRDDENRALRGMPDKDVQLFVDRYTLALEQHQGRAPSPDAPNGAALKAFALQEGQRLKAAGRLPDFAALDAVGDPAERQRQRQAMLGQLDNLVAAQPAAGPWRPYVPPPPANNAAAAANQAPARRAGWCEWLTGLVGC